MADLKEKLRADLSAAMKARDEVRLRTLRMALTAITNEEVAGKAARGLSDDEVVDVLVKEAKRRREAAEAFSTGGRPERAADEEAEAAIIASYLPPQLTEEEITAIVTEAIIETGASDIKAMGQVMKVVSPQTRGRADGARVAAEVRRQLSSD